MKEVEAPEEEFCPYKEVLAIPIEPLNRLIISNEEDELGGEDNFYWHFVV